MTNGYYYFQEMALPHTPPYQQKPKSEEDLLSSRHATDPFAYLIFNNFSPALTSTSVKPILKSGKHKRCSSLGHGIRYIDDAPSTPPTHVSYEYGTSGPIFGANPCGYGPSLVPNHWNESTISFKPNDATDIYSSDYNISSFDEFGRPQNLDTSLLPSLPTGDTLFSDDDNFPNNDTIDRQSLYSIHMEKDFRYVFGLMSSQIGVLASHVFNHY